MKTVNIHEAKTQLSKLIEEASKGEAFVIAKAGKPVVKVTALGSPTGTQIRRLGFMTGQISVPDDFDRMGKEEIERIFGGGGAWNCCWIRIFFCGQPVNPSDFQKARTLIDDPNNELLFSTASLWEVAIKRGLGREDFKVDARLLRRGLLDSGYRELAIISDHVVATESLPPIHKDPFDRVLVAQATVEGVTLLTIDSLVAQYPGPIKTV
jgi:prevent-host-death family protein